MANDNETKDGAATQHLKEAVPLLEGIEEAYATGDYSDATVTCKGMEVKVHRLVLCSRSEFFRKAWNGPFKEAKERTIDLPDDEPHAVDAMLSYLYKHDYGDQGNSWEVVAPILLHVLVFTIADKYFIPKLKVIAADKFKKRAAAEWSSAAFADSINEIYTAGPAEDRTLHEVVLETTKEHATELFTNEEAYERFHVVLAVLGEFSADLSKRLALGLPPVKEEPKKATTYRCPGCSTQFTVTILATYTRFGCPCGCYGRQSGISWNEHIV